MQGTEYKSLGYKTEVHFKIKWDIELEAGIGEREREREKVDFWSNIILPPYWELKLKTDSEIFLCKFQ